MPTQVEIAEHLDLSERRVRDIFQELGLDTRRASLDEVRLAYIRDLREKAAGRGGDDHASLTRARTREAEASAELKQLQILERSKQLVPVAEVEPQLLAMVTAARTELLALPDALAQELRALHGVDVDASLIEDRINVALSHLANRLQDDLAGDVDAGGESVGTAA